MSPADPPRLSHETATHPEADRTADDALVFLRQMQREHGVQGPSDARVAEVLAQIAATGGYEQTTQELVWGAKIAWRNTPRCLGKFYWTALRVADMRHLTTADEIFNAIVAHLHMATNGGRVKLLMTVFAAARPGRPGIRIWNSQLVRYAGYRQPDGSVVGDPATVEFSDAAQALGWRPPSQGPFDILPLVIQMPGEEPRLYELPPEAVLEVPISHPTLNGLSDLGLRWYAFPSISDQRLEIGGISYTAAPFSAWYTCTEVGARNLSDISRYNALPAVARLLGLNTSSDRTLWKDRAMLELTEAVVHSFDRAGVSMIDHHFATKQFVSHEAREHKAGRTTPAHWELIVPPTGGSATPVWERHYEPTILRPNFFPQPQPWTAGAGAAAESPVHRRYSSNQG
jgi:nitric-oxide synthase